MAKKNLFLDYNSVNDKFLDDVSKNNFSAENISFAVLGWSLSLFKTHHSFGKALIILPDEKMAQSLYNNLLFYLPSEEVCFFPDFGVLPYESMMPAKMVSHSRLKAQYQLTISNRPVLVVASVMAASRKLLAPDIFRQKISLLKIGEEYPREKLIHYLNGMGYVQVNRVEQAGDYSIRGEIVDIFSNAHLSPLRLIFFDNELEEIKLFNINSQLSFQKLKECVLLPKKEFIVFENLSDKAIIDFEEKFKNCENIEKICHDLRANKTIPFIHEIIPCLVETAPLLNYLNSNDRCLFYDPINCKTMFEAHIHELWNAFEHPSKINKIKVAPDDLYSNPEDLKQLLDLSIRINDKNTAETNTRDFLKHLFRLDPWQCSALLPLREGKFPFMEIRSFKNYKSDIKAFIKESQDRIKKGYIIVVVVNSKEQANRMKNILQILEPLVSFKGETIDFEEKIGEEKVWIICGSLEEGFTLENRKLIFVCENEIFGRPKKKHRFFKKEAPVIENFIQLKEGDLVVHVNHGIGRYIGLNRMSIGDKEKDFLKIEYAQKSHLFIPVEQVNLVQKYIGKKNDGSNSLDILGGKAWDKIKKRVKKAVQDIAKDLIQVYALRSRQKKTPLGPDTTWQFQFELEFPFEETVDQLKAVEEIKAEMESVTPMDRLVCGDVGFGKTEVAMRACFKCVMEEKQVLFLCPTTILSQQHYHSFVERFKNFPFRVEVINRFKSSKNQKEILKDFSFGKIDILIGTHRLLSKDVNFNHLGLLVVDEEQKFGVKHKEIIKKRAALVDTLSLSATPIPRSLHMSLINIRSLSVINTPPTNRLPVQTLAMEFNEELIKQGIEREIERGGQVFFLHNRVETISSVFTFIQDLMPDLKIAVAHGQMPENELENIMNEFIAGKYDLLLATTIIDSGLDIPNANTIFINNVEFFGLSQLYQLRGRVGRSHRQSYCYLFYRKGMVLSEESMKRVQVISDHTALGSGFSIAMKDLEIRGAGNILGSEQSGNIVSVGFDMYCQLLEEAIVELKPEIKKVSNHTVLDLKYSGYIPDSYVPDNNQKIEVYKKLSRVKNHQELDELLENLADRYGKPPKIIHLLSEISQFRFQLGDWGIRSLMEKKDFVEIILFEKNQLNINLLLQKMTQSEDFIINPQDNLRLSIKLPEPPEDEESISLNDKIEFLQHRLRQVFLK